MANPIFRVMFNDVISETDRVSGSTHIHPAGNNPETLATVQAADGQTATILGVLASHKPVPGGATRVLKHVSLMDLRGDGTPHNGPAIWT